MSDWVEGLMVEAVFIGISHSDRLGVIEVNNEPFSMDPGGVE